MRDHSYFAAIISQMDLSNVDTREAYVCNRICGLTSHLVRGLLWNEHSVMPRNITKLTTNQYSFNRIYGTCVQPVPVLVNFFDKQITAAENVCPQRREVIMNGN